MKGQLSERPFSDLLSELYRNHSNGILTLTRDKQTKAIFIEEGSPVFALSNAPEDQLGDLLQREGLISEEKLSELARGANMQQLVQKLSQSGVIPQDILDSAVQRMNKNIILSIFDWPNGDFNFEKKDRARLNMLGKLKEPAPALLLNSFRKNPNTDLLNNIFVDGNKIVKPAPNSQDLLKNIPLEPMEGYVLSRISEPLPLNTVFSLTGLPEEQTKQCLYILIVSGLLQLDGGIPRSAPKTNSRPQNSGAYKAPEETAPKVPTPKSTGAEQEFNEEKFAKDVIQLLAFFASADFYEMLGVTRKASEAEIKKAYYQLAKKYHPDRVHKSSSPELKNNLEKAFAKITEAYEKLKDPDSRKRYDETIRGKAERNSGVMQSSRPTPSTTANQSTTARSTGQQQPFRPEPPAPTPEAPRPGSSPPKPVSPPPSRPAAPPPQPAAPSPVAAQATSAPAGGAPKAAPVAAKAEAGQATSAASAAPVNRPAKTPDMAEATFNQGKQAFDRGDIVRAAYLLREAVSAAPDNKQYRMQLVQALLKNQKWHKEAEENLHKLVELEPFNALHHVMLGQIYKYAGLNTRATAKFKEALSIDPGNRQAKKELKAMIESGNTSDGVESAAGGLIGKFKALSPTVQYAIIGVVALLVLYLLYSTLLGSSTPPSPPPKPAAPAGAPAAAPK